MRSSSSSSNNNNNSGAANQSNFGLAKEYESVAEGDYDSDDEKAIALSKKV